MLVVDDDPLIAMSTVDMLEDLGHLSGLTIADRQGSVTLAVAWI